ncbi:MAG TPA: DUF3891 family protein [Gaiellaceae bacterium]|jgi:hypothetical protein|nr:DUF3891 family protein [Gaiellaceae bacterium]
MIVRDLGDSWQVVFQTDHADLSGDAADAWAEKGAGHHSLALAARRHDDGWAVWEQAPQANESGKPVNFLEVDVRSHLAFYRAGIAAITEQDADAGLLVSMHGAGIYKQRYGLDPGLGLQRAAEVQDEVDAFVAEQEAKFGGDPGGRRADYDLLQFYDRLSLYFCLREGESAELQGYSLEPVGRWHVRLDPYPFVERPAKFSLLRYTVSKRDRTSTDLQRELRDSGAERVEITIE